MPNIQDPREKRKSSGPPPTVAFLALQQMPNWKKNVLFIFGIVGIGGVVAWFALLGPHTKWEIIGSAVLLMFFWWAIAPEWWSRKFDKVAPSFFRRDRRG